MVTAGIIAIVVALALGVTIGVLLSRPSKVAPVLPDPVVLQTYAAKRAALAKEAPNAEALTLSDAAAALRRMAHQ